ncbi:MAG TPA: phosphatase PAP2 family protein [Pseudolabrys sp.]|nr:phosphatase PAP2 family protein [Pseudolabrys sp.]
MSLANGLNRSDRPSAMVLRRCAANVASALGVLSRSPRMESFRLGAFSPVSIASVAIAAVLTFLVLAMTIDPLTARAIRNLPSWVISFFQEITDFGKSGWFLWPLGVLFFLLASMPPVLTPVSQRVVAAVMVRIGFLFMAIAVPSLFVTIVKRIIGRARPMVGGSLDPLLFDPIAWQPAYASMPSGHTTTAFAVLVAFGTLWPRGRTVLLVYALLMAMSRIVISAHYPTDVLAGAVVGMGGAILVRRYFAQRHLGFSMNKAGGIHQYAGPSLSRIKAVARELLA